ncbi:hypothetical protein ABIE41_003348 [Bosea sp. OAE506]
MAARQGQPRIDAGLAGKAAGLPGAVPPVMIGACHMNRPSPRRIEPAPAMIPTASPTILSATGR